MSFKTHITESLKELSRESSFEVNDIKSTLHRCSEPLIKEHKGETLCRHRLLLVSTKNEGFLSGLESYEYTLSGEDTNRFIVYISKVDTTMTLQKYKGLTVRLVDAYISSLPPNTKIFVFARAQPEYLFAESAKNKLKSTLNDRHLVSWWLSALNKVSVKCEGWWTIPGIDDPSSALIEIGARQRGWNPSNLIKWHYGTSFDDNAIAEDVIPRFEDDAKSRLLKSLRSSDEKLTVNDFWNILSIGEECGSGKITGFFELRILGDHESGEIEEKSELKTSDFTIFWNRFMSLDFHDSESSLKSTQQALSDMKSIFPNLKQTVIEKATATCTTNSEVDDVKIDSSMTEKRPAINMLSGSFIKRKKI